MKEGGNGVSAMRKTQPITADFKGGGKGQEPMSMGSLEKMVKARKLILC